MIMMIINGKRIYSKNSITNSNHYNNNHNMNIVYRLLLLLMAINIVMDINGFNLMVNGQVISFGMRKLAYSTNQFGLDLIRAMDKSDVSIAFCPICISSSLVMMLMGSQGNGAASLRHALYLWGMQTSEINLAFHDMMTHLGVNMPTAIYRNNGAGPIIASINNYYADDYIFSGYNHHHNHRLASPSSASPSASSSSSPVATGAGGMTLADTEAASGNDIAFLSHVYVQRDFSINYNYHMLLQRFYKTAIHPLDFIDNADETRHHINAMVEKETRGKISTILPQKLPPTTQLLLLSALYFKGSLDLNITSNRRSGRRFKLPPPIAYTPPPQMSSVNIYKQPSSQSSMQPTSPLKPSTLPMASMPPYSGGGLGGNGGVAGGATFSTAIFGDDHVIMEAKNARIRWGINKYLNCTAIEMPFKGGLITMIAIMPNDPHGLDTVLTKLSAQVLSDVVNSLQVKRVNVKIPRLNFEKNGANISQSLANLGLSHIFKPGFSQLYDISDYKWLHVSDLIHMTYLEIRDNPANIYKQNSKPTSSSSSFNHQQTMSSSSSSSTVPHHHYPHQHHKRTRRDTFSVAQSHQSSNMIDVIFDRPFLYFIMDNVSGLILAMGKYGREPVNYRLPI